MRSTLPWSRRYVRVPTAVIVLAFTWPCGATPNFPAVVQQFVGAAQAPSCTICHNNPSGGLGTATTPFGTYMRSQGVVPYDQNSLEAALRADQTANHDSNGDGVSDIDALKQGLDPNGEISAQAPPAYGCQIGRVARHQAMVRSMTATMFLGLLGLSRRRFKVQKPRSRHAGRTSTLGFHRPSVLVTLFGILALMAAIASTHRDNIAPSAPGALSGRSSPVWIRLFPPSSTP